MKAKRTTLKPSSPIVVTEQQRYTAAELIGRYVEAEAYVRVQLEDLIEIANVERKKLIDKLAKGFIGEVAEQIRWGYAVKEDLAAWYARMALDALDEGIPTIRVIEHMRDRARNDARYANAQSSSAFANAVTIEKLDVARNLAEKFGWYLEHLTERRAQLEVL